MENISMDVTPVPNVLIALTNNPMKPLDAISELIDNSIDSFSAGRLQGEIIESPTIVIELPSRKDLQNGAGLLRIKDNGPGMTQEQMKSAMTAGYSSNNQYDTLGLFGMGFNISTGKMGNRTVVMSAKRGLEYYTKATINLEELKSAGTYHVPAQRIEKGPDEPFRSDESGTVVEVSEWWPDGQQNSGYVAKLIAYGRPKIREAIGRRYATYLRDSRVTIIIDGEPCKPYEHCAWGSNRFVKHGNERIPARFDFDEVIHTTRRCANCRTVLSDSDTECPNCHSTVTRTIEERVKGWVGIQRYDDASDFGIDLIRNGRAIKIGEKDAFFTYVDEFGNSIRDYPIDSVYGRIIGEVSIDAVPVDYMKQDFIRSSAEWNRAIAYLRGESSLQPKRPGADKNHSPIFKLYQGYRRVRDAGLGVMYMGYWDESEQKPKRISREVEQEYLKRFQNHEPGYYDDAEWWKLVEQASQKPMPKLIECPDCGFQNLEEAESCISCGHIFKGKACINPSCGETIPLSAVTCPKCGASQIPEKIEPWVCEICGRRNSADNDTCSSCGSPRGTENKLSEDYLTDHSMRDDDLSSTDLIATMPDGGNCDPISVDVFVTNGPMVDALGKQRLPMMAFKTPHSTHLFIDTSHPLFAAYGVAPHEVVAYEMGVRLLDRDSSLASSPVGSYTNTMWGILRERWGDVLAVDKDDVREKASQLLDDILLRLADTADEHSALFADELSDAQKQEMTKRMISSGVDLGHISAMMQSGQYLEYVPHDFILTLLSVEPDALFSNRVFEIPYTDDIGGYLSSEVVEAENSAAKERIRNCLVDIIGCEENPTNDVTSLRRSALSISFLREKMVD